MDEQLLQQVIQLVRGAMSGDQQATQYIQQIMQAAQQGDEQAMQIAQMIQEVAQSMRQEQVRQAKFGAKLNYIKRLKGLCPDGYDMAYFKKGGKVCKQCIKKNQQGNTMNGSVVDQFKSAKCGSKMKKKACGGPVKSEKCGGSVKKGQSGGQVKEVSSTTTYPSRLEGNKRTVQTFSDGTQAVQNSGWGPDGIWRASFRGRLGEFGNTAGNPRERAIADSLNRVDWMGTSPRFVPAIKKKISKHLFGGKPRKPFTGFEGLSYYQEDPYVPSSAAQSRAERPLIEEVRNPRGLVIGRETWIGDPSETGYYDPSMNGAETDYEPNETKRRVFDSLKRHALMNQELGNRKFACGGKTKKMAKGGNRLKTPYRSELGYVQDRGGGTQYVHRVYPENDSYYIDVQYNDEGLYSDQAKRFVYNPTGANFNYDEYDYSKTAPAKRYDYYKETSPGNWETIKEGQYEFFDQNGNIDPNITGGQQVEYLRQLNLPLVEPKMGFNNLPRGYKGQRIYK